MNTRTYIAAVVAIAVSNVAASLVGAALHATTTTTAAATATATATESVNPFEALLDQVEADRAAGIVRPCRYQTLCAK